MTAGSIYFITVALTCALGPLVIAAIFLLKGKLQPQATFGDRVLLALPLLWILYGVSFCVFIVLGALYYIFGAG